MSKIVSLNQYIIEIQSSSILLSGTSGTADVTVDGTPYVATFNTDLATTATDFVSAHEAAILTQGITVSSEGDTLIFTGGSFSEFTLIIANTAGDLSGTVNLIPSTVAIDKSTNSIITVEDKISYREVSYSDRGVIKNIIQVSDTLSAIEGEAPEFVSVTLDGVDVLLVADKIISIEDVTVSLAPLVTERVISYNEIRSNRKTKRVPEALAALIADAGNLIPVTVGVADVALSADRIESLIPFSTGAKVFYDSEQAAKEAITTVEAPAAIEALVDAL
jgi:hypothetical protein